MKKNILSSEIYLNFKPSNFLWWWMVLFSTVVIFCVWYCCFWAWALFATLIYALACVFCYLQFVGTTYPRSIRTLRVDVYGAMTLTNVAGRVFKVEVLPDSVVHSYCIVLHVTQSDTKITKRILWSQFMHALLNTDRILILPDHAQKDMLRKLRVWLKWGAKVSTING